MATQVSGVNDWLTLNGRPLLFHPVTDNLAAEAQEYKTNRLRITPKAPDEVVIRVDGEPLHTEVYGRWDWYPMGYAGLYDLEISAPGHGMHRTQVRVLPSHLTQQTHEMMLEQISQLSRDLLFQLRSPASEWMSAGDLEQKQSPLRTYKLIETMMGELEDAVARIARAPHRSLVRQTVHRQWHEVTQYGPSVVAVSGPVVALPPNNTRLPNVWPLEWREEQSTLTYDVYENRLLKHFLWQQLLPRLDNLQQRAEAEISRREVTVATADKRGWHDTAEREAEQIRHLEEVAANCRQMQRSVIGWGSLPFLKPVNLRLQRTVPTQVLQKHPAYGRFYQIYLRFQRELKRGLSNEGFLTRIAMRQMWQLYETWANLRLTRILLVILEKNGYQPVSDKGFFRVDDELFHFEVDRQAEIVMVKGEVQVHIRYEPLYPASKRVSEGIVTDRPYDRTPDMAVELWEDGRAEALLIFDPKYKTDVVDGKPPGQDSILAGGRGPAQADIDKMSQYYGEFAWKAHGAKGRLPGIVAGAYVVYPGAVIVHDAQYPTVGALPLVPGSQKQTEVGRTLMDLLAYAGFID